MRGNKTLDTPSLTAEQLRDVKKHTQHRAEYISFVQNETDRAELSHNFSKLAAVTTLGLTTISSLMAAILIKDDESVKSNQDLLRAVLVFSILTVGAFWKMTSTKHQYDGYKRYLGELKERSQSLGSEIGSLRL